MRNICLMPNCGEVVDWLGRCHRHAAYFRKHGRDNHAPVLRTAEERFYARVGRGLGDCWLWLGSTASQGRYGRFGGMQAHAWAYTHLVGPIPDGLVIDHLCRTTLCVNPAHLEPVTQTENILRGRSPQAINATKTHCPQGHEYTPENTYRPPAGGRACRICMRKATREGQRRYRARQKAKRAA